MDIQEELLLLLACPRCRGALEKRNDPPGLACPSCALIYPVRDGIPIMLPEEALPDAACARPPAGEN